MDQKARALSDFELCRELYCDRRLSTSGGLPGMRLRRGYQLPPEGVTVQEADPKAEEADDAAATQPISKLLLVVHGIGQNLSGSNIAGQPGFSGPSDCKKCATDSEE